MQVFFQLEKSSELSEFINMLELAKVFSISGKSGHMLWSLLQILISFKSVICDLQRTLKQTAPFQMEKRYWIIH